MEQACSCHSRGKTIFQSSFLPQPPLKCNPTASTPILIATIVQILPSQSQSSPYKPPLVWVSRGGGGVGLGLMFTPIPLQTCSNHWGNISNSRFLIKWWLYRIFPFDVPKLNIKKQKQRKYVKKIGIFLVFGNDIQWCLIVLGGFQPLPIWLVGEVGKLILIGKRNFIDIIENRYRPSKHVIYKRKHLVKI